MIEQDELSYSNEEVAKRYDNPLEVYNNLERWGRVSNSLRYYTHHDGCETEAADQYISVDAVLHQTTSGAQQYLEWLSASTLNNPTYVASTDLVGDVAYVMQFEGTFNCSPISTSYFRVMFQRYNALGIVTVGTTNTAPDIDAMRVIAVRLSKLMDLKFVVNAK